MRLNGFLTAAALAALLVSAGASAQDRPAPVQWQQSPIVFLPVDAASGSASFVEGSSVIVFPLRWALSTRLGREVVLQHRDETVTMAAESLLPMVRIRQAGGDRFAFCTRSRVADAQEGRGFMGLMFGSMLNGAMDQQVCLEDSDKDNALDRGLVLGDGDAIIELGAIEPLPFEELLAEPMGTEGDYARIALRGVGRRNISIQFDIYQMGQARVFSDFQSGRFFANSMRDYRLADDGTVAFDLLGVRFSVTEPNRQTNSATVSWQATAAPEEFIFVPNAVQQRYTW